MNLGEAPQFIAVEVDMATTNKLKNILIAKFHLDNDFFKHGSQDPSQRYIIFRLAGPIYPRDVASINEVSASGSFFMHRWYFVHLDRFWIISMEGVFRLVR